MSNNRFWFGQFAPPISDQFGEPRNSLIVLFDKAVGKYKGQFATAPKYIDLYYYEECYGHVTDYLEKHVADEVRAKLKPAKLDAECRAKVISHYEAYVLEQEMQQAAQLEFNDNRYQQEMQHLVDCDSETSERLEEYLEGQDEFVASREAGWPSEDEQGEYSS